MAQSTYTHIAELYDAFVRTQFDIPFWLEEARQADGDILELMAGTGRVTLPLLEVGARLTAVDNSAEMLTILREKLAQQGLSSASVHEMDVRKLAFDKRFARIIPFYKLGIKDNIIGLFTFLLDPAENISQMMDELFRYLRTHKSKWDILSLHHVPSDMNGIDDFLSLGSKNFNIKINETKTLVVAKPVEFADILSQMNGKKRREMKRKIRRLSEDGDLELISINDHTKIEQYLPTFFDIENNNWKGKMGTSILKSPYLPFFEQMALYLSERKKFHLYLLKIKKVFVSGIYAVVDNDTLYFVKIGYDENYAKYSPSLVLFYLVFEQLTKQYQIQYIDFFGPIDSYQTIFGKTTRTSYDLTIFNRKLVPSFYHFTLMLFNKIQNYSFGKRVINTLLKIPLLKEKINNIYE